MYHWNSTRSRILLGALLALGLAAYQVIAPVAGMSAAGSATADASSQVSEFQVVSPAGGPPANSCCATFHLRGGRDDNFSLAGPAEPTTPSPGTPAARFDETAPNHALTHRFTLPNLGCICNAHLEMRLKPLHELTYNDALAVHSGSTKWGHYIGQNAGNAGLQGINNTWNSANYPTGHVFTFDLGNLGAGTTGSTSNLLSAMTTSRVLDFYIQDDTSVDYLTLTYGLQECSEREGALEQDLEETPSQANFEQFRSEREQLPVSPVTDRAPGR